MVNRLGLPPSLARRLVTTNIIESPQSGVRLRTRRICPWRDGRMVLRWARRGVLDHREEFLQDSGLPPRVAVKHAHRTEVVTG